MEPLTLAICDDLPEEREKLLRLLELSPIPAVCAQFGSSEELLSAFRPGKFDLLLMDIYMDGMTGVEAVQRIRELDERIPIAFTTTSTEHALEGYRLSVLKYLEKPVRQKDVNDLLRLVLEVVVGVAIYVGLSALFRLEAFGEVVGLVRRQLQRRR